MDRALLISALRSLLARVVVEFKLRIRGGHSRFKKVVVLNQFLTGMSVCQCVNCHARRSKGHAAFPKRHSKPSLRSICCLALWENIQEKMGEGSFQICVCCPNTCVYVMYIACRTTPFGDTGILLFH